VAKESKRRKPKKTFQERRKLWRRFLCEALKRTRVYQDFKREHLKEIQEAQQADTNFPPELRSNYDLEFNVQKAFFSTSRGQEIIENYGLWERHKSVTIIPYQKGTIEKGTFDSAPHLEARRYLTLKIDLKAPKDRIINEFTRALERYYSKVQRPPIPPRGIELPDSQEEMANICRAFDVVEKHGRNYLKAVWELFPETNGTHPYEDWNTDKNLSQVKRWYKKIKKIIGDL
jgi:hypothetical protein